MIVKHDHGYALELPNPCNDFQSKTIKSGKNLYVGRSGELLGEYILMANNSGHFLCRKCQFTCPSFTELSRHTCSSFSCYMCKVTQESLPLLREHLYQAHQILLCKCGYIASINVMGSHTCSMKNTSLAGMKKVYCSKCKFSSISEEILKQHMADHNEEIVSVDGDVIYNCPKCSYVSADSADFKRHKAGHGTPSPNTPCDFCDFCTTSHENLVKHINLHYYAHLICKCKSCSFTCADMQVFENHKKSHDMKHLYSCPLCPFKVYGKEEFLPHIKLHENNYVCKICGLINSSRVDFNNHVAGHKVKMVDQLKNNYRNVVSSKPQRRPKIVVSSPVPVSNESKTLISESEINIQRILNMSSVTENTRPRITPVPIHELMKPSLKASSQGVPTEQPASSLVTANPQMVAQVPETPTNRPIENTNISSIISQRILQTQYESHVVYSQSPMDTSHGQMYSQAVLNAPNQESGSQLYNNSQGMVIVQSPLPLNQVGLSSQISNNVNVIGKSVHTVSQNLVNVNYGSSWVQTTSQVPLNVGVPVQGHQQTNLELGTIKVPTSHAYSSSLSSTVAQEQVPTTSHNSSQTCPAQIIANLPSPGNFQVQSSTSQATANSTGFVQIPISSKSKAGSASTQGPILVMVPKSALPGGSKESYQRALSYDPRSMQGTQVSKSSCYALIAQVPATSRGPAVSQNSQVPTTSQVNQVYAPSHNPKAPAVSQNPQAPTTSQVNQVYAPSHNPKAPAVSQNPQVPTTSQVNQVYAVSHNPKAPAVSQNSQVPTTSQVNQVYAVSHNSKAPAVSQNLQVPTTSQVNQVYAVSHNPKAPAVSQNLQVPTTSQVNQAYAVSHNPKAPAVSQNSQVPTTSHVNQVYAVSHNPKAPPVSQNSQIPTTSQVNQVYALSHNPKAPAVSQNLQVSAKSQDLQIAGRSSDLQVTTRPQNPEAPAPSRNSVAPDAPKDPLELDVSQVRSSPAGSSWNPSPLLAPSANEVHVNSNNPIHSNNLHPSNKEPPVSYSCNYCSFVTLDKTVFERHKLSHLQFKIIFTCTCCFFTSGNEQQYNQHKSRHREASTYFTCVECSYTVTSRELFDKHTHEISQFNCNLCPFSCSLKASLDLHTKMNHNSDKVAEKPLTQSKVADTENLENAAQNGEQDTRDEECIDLDSSEEECMMVCRKCPFATISAKSLKEHEESHEESANPRDEVVEAVMVEKDGPLIDVNTEEDPCTLYNCNYCNYCTDVADNIKQHTKAHIEEKNRQRALNRQIQEPSPSEDNVKICKYCNFTSADREKLERHEAEHKKDLEVPSPEEVSSIYNCSLCNYSCSNVTEISQHAMAHINNVGSKKSFSMACAHCDFATRDKEAWKLHELTHSSNATFNCGECDHRAESQEDLFTHQLMEHTSKRTQKCPICSFKGTPYSITVHFEQDHTSPSDETNKPHKSPARNKKRKPSGKSSSKNKRRKR